MDNFNNIIKKIAVHFLGISFLEMYGYLFLFQECSFNQILGLKCFLLYILKK